MKARYWSVLFVFAVVLGGEAEAQQRSYAGTSETFYPAFATVSERYARDVYLELLRAQPQMVDKKHERHRCNAIVEVSFTVGKAGRFDP